MTFIVVVCGIVLFSRCLWLEYRHNKDIAIKARQRKQILDVYLERRRRELPADFELWNMEIEDAGE